MGHARILAAAAFLLAAPGSAAADDAKPRALEVAPPPRPVQTRPMPKGGRPGEVITPAARGERLPDKLKVGDAAPDFTLSSVDGKKPTTLSDFKGKKTAVLIFASYT